MTCTERPTRTTRPRFPGWGTELDIAEAIQRATDCDPIDAERAADDVVELLQNRGIEL